MDLEALKAAALATLKRRREAEKESAKANSKETDLSALRKAALLSAANKKRNEDEEFEEISNTSSEFSLIEDDNDRSEQDASSLLDDGAIPDLLDDVDEFDMDDLITDDKPQQDSLKPKLAPTKLLTPKVKDKVKSHKGTKPKSEEKTSKPKSELAEKPRLDEKPKQKTEQKLSKPRTDERPAPSKSSREVKVKIPREVKPAREVLSPREVKPPIESRSLREVKPPSDSKPPRKRTVVESSSRTSQSSAKRDLSRSPVKKKSRSRSPPRSPLRSQHMATTRTRHYSEDCNGDNRVVSKSDSKQRIVQREELKDRDEKLTTRPKRNVKERLKISRSRTRSPVQRHSSRSRSPIRQTSAHDRLNIRSTNETQDKILSSNDTSRKRDLHSRLGAKLTDKEAENLKKDEMSPIKKQKIDKSTVSARGRLGNRKSMERELDEDLYTGLSTKRSSRKIYGDKKKEKSRRRADTPDSEDDMRENRSNNNRNYRDKVNIPTRLSRRTSTTEDNIYKPGQRKKSTNTDTSSKPPLKSKHEQDLDEKIRQIKEKNAALEARQKLIEQEKRMFG